MANVYVKTVNGGETTSPTGAEGVPLDNGTTSTWISLTNIAVYVWGYLTSLTAKTTPVDADQLGIADSAASNVGKKVTLSNFAAYIYNYLTSLTAKTSLVDADQLALADSAASNVGKKITWANVKASMIYPLVLYGATTSWNPADATTYYWGAFTVLGGTTTAAVRKIFMPRAGTIKRVDIVITNNAGTTGSNETSTISLRLNNTSDTTLTSSFTADMAAGALSSFNITGLSIAVAAGDYVEFKWVTPTWATNPTGITLQGQIYLE